MKMINLTVIFLVFQNISFANDSSFQCMKTLKEISNKYSDNSTILLKCNEKENSCPFSSGEYDKKTKAIALPYNNKGDRGAVIYLDGKSNFVKFQTKGIKNDEKRLIKFNSSGKEYCAEYSRTFGLAQDGIYKPIYNAISNVSDYLNSSLIGYSFNFIENDKCKSAVAKKSNDLTSIETEKLLNGAIERVVHDMTYMTEKIDLKKDMLNAEWMPANCFSKKCSIKTKEKYQELVNALSDCQKNTVDKELANTLKESLDKITTQAKVVGLIPNDSQSKTTTNSASSGAVPK